MSLPPILYHRFKTPLPYARTLALQEKVHQVQLHQRRSSSHPDILFLLEHRPVYTAGRRQTEEEVQDERKRLTHIGADFVTTARGGQLTYHGPGQLVGYPLLDLGRTSPAMGIRDYVCRTQKTIEKYLLDAHGIQHVPTDHTGVFINPTTKIASIGIQARHRLTSHGFAMNVTKEPISWFDQVVACGLDDVKAGCVESATGEAISVADVIPGIVSVFGKVFQRDLEELNVGELGEIGEAIEAIEQEARDAGDWRHTPII